MHASHDPALETQALKKAAISLRLQVHHNKETESVRYGLLWNSNLKLEGNRTQIPRFADVT